METRALEVVSLSKREFDNLRATPENCLFFVYDEYIHEEKKAKKRIRLYKGATLVCDDHYETFVQIHKEIEKLKGLIGDDDGKIRYENIVTVPKVIRYNNKRIKIYDLYPAEIHDRLQGAIYRQSTQLLVNCLPYNTIFHEPEHDLVFIEDSQPLDKEIAVKPAPYIPFLYERSPSENMAIDYHRDGNFLYPVIRGGRKVSLDDINQGIYVIDGSLPSFHINEEGAYRSWLSYHKKDGSQIDGAEGHLLASPEEFNLSHEQLSFKGADGKITIVLDDSGLNHDSLGRFFMYFSSGFIPDNIDFKAVHNPAGEYATVFSIDLREYQKQHLDLIEFSPYGIRGRNHSGSRIPIPIVHAKDMDRIDYSVETIRKIELHYSNSGPEFYPDVSIYKGPLYG